MLANLNLNGEEWRGAHFFHAPILLDVCMLSSDVWSFRFVISLLFLTTTVIFLRARESGFAIGLFLKPLRLILLLITISTNSSQNVGSAGCEQSSFCWSEVVQRLMQLRNKSFH